MTERYKQEASRLGKAIDIAIEATEKYPPKDFEQKHIDHWIKVHQEWKRELFECEPKYQNLATLKYSVNNVLTYFQEAYGEGVEFFWQQIAKQGLGYKRENKLAKILKRNRIKDDIEYDFIIDVIVPYQQENIITSEEANILSDLLLKFEEKAINLK